MPKQVAPTQPAQRVRSSFWRVVELKSCSCRSRKRLSSRNGGLETTDRATKIISVGRTNDTHKLVWVGIACLQKGIHYINVMETALPRCQAVPGEESKHHVSRLESIIQMEGSNQFTSAFGDLGISKVGTEYYTRT